MNGVIRVIPEEEYRADKNFVSISELNILARSPKAFKNYQDGLAPFSKSKAQELGTLFHLCLLEPEKFEQKVVKAPDLDRRTKAGRDAFAEVEAEAASLGKILAKEEEILVCKAARDEVLTHSFVRDYFKTSVRVENAIYWTDVETGVACKGRFDAHSLEFGLLDVKTTKDAAHFSSSIGQYRYHRQASFYADGCSACGLPVPAFYWLAVELEPPNFHFAIYKCDDESIELGRREYKKLLKKLDDCRKHDFWPGLPSEIRTLGLPEWVKKQIILEEENG